MQLLTHFLLQIGQHEPTGEKSGLVTEIYIPTGKKRGSVCMSNALS